MATQKETVAELQTAVASKKKTVDDLEEQVSSITSRVNKLEQGGPTRATAAAAAAAAARPGSPVELQRAAEVEAASTGLDDYLDKLSSNKVAAKQVNNTPRDAS